MVTVIIFKKNLLNPCYTPDKAENLKR